MLRPAARGGGDPDVASSLAVYRDAKHDCEEVFVGTGPVGAVYRFCPAYSDSVTPLATGLGDTLKFGTCQVNSLVVADLDDDGVPELIAETSQVFPLGRPRLYVWSLETTPVLRGMARPEIDSSWGHGLSVVGGAESSERVISTYCGHGEIVEYQLASDVSTAGFHHESIGWRQIGQLPASGECVQVADVDNDGEPDLCVATGFSFGHAAIHVYSLTDQGIGDSPKFLLDEQGRFGNVKFLVVDSMMPRSRTIFAWWCTGLNDGECEVIRYRLGPGGLRERTLLGRGSADLLWPSDGQMTLAESSHDRAPEVWFVTGSGNVWRIASWGRFRMLRHVCKLDAEVGPIVAGHPRQSQAPGLYIASGKSVLRLERTEPLPQNWPQRWSMARGLGPVGWRVPAPMPTARYPAPAPPEQRG